MLTACLGAFLSLLNGASAADLSADKVAAAAPAFSWAGCYVGVHAGGGRLNSVIDGTDGAVAGGQIGCNHQIGRVVIGVEAEGFWSGLSASTQWFTPTLNPALFVIHTREVQNHWDADVALRLGFTPVDRLMIYGKAGAVLGGFEYNSAAGISSRPFKTTNNSTQWGAMLGVGSELALSQNWSAKAEYNYIHYAPEDVELRSCMVFPGAIGCGSRLLAVSADKHLVKLGLNYRWTWTGGPP